MNETPLMRATDVEFRSWRKASRSTTQGSCVEISEDATGGIAVRDSKDPAGPKLHFQAAEWSFFLNDIRTGHFDLS